MSFFAKFNPKTKKTILITATVSLALFTLVFIFRSTPRIMENNTQNDQPANYNKYYSAYYDLLYKDKNYDQEVSYLDSLIQRFYQNYDPKKMSLLELGCGTGKHANLLNTNFGYSVHGVDMSREMVAQARAKYGEQNTNSLRFSVGDARSWRDPNREKYDVALSLFHVVSYQVTNEDLMNQFKTAATHVKENGLFIFDVWYGPTVLTERPTEREKTMENEQIIVTRFAKPVLHPNTNVVDVNYKINVRDKVTGEVNIFTEKHPMRYLFKPELEFYLEQNGFSLVTYEEWVTGKEAGFDTWGVTFVALKM